MNAASQNAIDFIGAGGILTVSGAALDASEGFLPVVVGFNASDSIDFAGTATSASYSGGDLTLYDGTTAVAEFELNGNYAGETFKALPITLEPSGASGTQITVLGQGDTAPPAGTSTQDQYLWGSDIAGSWDLASDWIDTTDEALRRSRPGRTTV